MTRQASGRCEAGLEWTERCQKCGKLRQSTRAREIYTKNYQGSCGDSFCYASCEMSACKPIQATVCDACAKLLSRPAGPEPGERRKRR